MFGGLLRIYHIDRAPIWIDEAYTILTASQSFTDIIAAQRGDSSPPLFYFLLHLWMRLVGDGETAARLSSAAAGTALIAGVYVVGRRLISHEAGLAAALIMAVSPIQVYYAQQVRMYTLLPLLALASVYFLVRFMHERRWGHFFLYELATVACLYTHNYAMFLLAAEAALVAASGGLWKRRGDWVAMAAVAAAGYLPWLPVFLQQLDNTGPFAWYGVFWQQWGPIGSALRTLQSFAIGGAQPPYVGLQASVLGGVLPTWTFGVLALMGGISMARRVRRDGAITALWAPTMVVVPLLVSALSSLVLSPNYAPGRVDQMVFPAYCLMVGAGVRSVRWRPARLMGAGLILALGGITMREHHRRDYRGEDRDLARFVAHQAAPGEPVLCTSLTRASLTYYLRRWSAGRPLYSFPRPTAGHLGYQHDAALLADPAGLYAEADTVLDDLRQRVGPNGSFTVVLALLEVNGALMAALERAADLQLQERPAQFRQTVTGVPVNVLRFRVADGHGAAGSNGMQD